MLNNRAHAVYVGTHDADASLADNADRLAAAAKGINVVPALKNFNGGMEAAHHFLVIVLRYPFKQLTIKIAHVYSPVSLQFTLISTVYSFFAFL